MVKEITPLTAVRMPISPTDSPIESASITQQAFTAEVEQVAQLPQIVLSNTVCMIG